MYGLFIAGFVAILLIFACFVLALVCIDILSTFILQIRHVDAIFEEVCLLISHIHDDAFCHRNSMAHSCQWLLPQRLPR